MKNRLHRSMLPSTKELFPHGSKNSLPVVSLGEALENPKVKQYLEHNPASIQVMKDLENETADRAEMYTTEMLYSKEIDRLYGMMSRRFLTSSSTAIGTKNTDFVRFLTITIVGSYRTETAEGFTSFLTERDRSMKPLAEVIPKYNTTDEEVVDLLLKLPGVRENIEYGARYALVEFSELCSYMYINEKEKSALFEYFGKYKNIIFGHMCSFADCTLNYAALKYLGASPMVPESDYVSVKNQFDTLKTQFADLKYDNSRLQGRVKELEEEISSNQEVKYLKEVNSDLSLSISRLESKHLNAVNEIKRLREIIKDLGMQELEEDGRTSNADEQLVDVSKVLNGKYAFVGLAGGDRDCYINTILERFPNSTFLDGQRDLSGLDKCDAVVYFVNFTSHSYYYKVKRYCKSRKIKFVHCNDWNIDNIINLLQTLISYNI